MSTGAQVGAWVVALVVLSAVGAAAGAPFLAPARTLAAPGPVAPAAGVAASGAVGPREPATSSPLYEPHWANLSHPGAPAPPGGPAVVAYDAKDAYVVWFGLAGVGHSGGETWTFASGTWLNRTATAGAGPRGATWGTAAYDATDSFLLWYGGGDAPSSDATWSYSSGTWTNLTGSLTAQPTPTRVLASGAYDPSLGGVVVFGGYDGTAYLGDTWEFSHGAWASLAATGPSARVSAGLAYDSTDGYLLLAGGGTAAGPASDTWALNGTNWSEIVASGGPVGIGGSQGLVSAPGGGVIGFGGVGCLGPLQGPCNVTEEFYLGAWHIIDPATGPSPRTGAQLVYDANDDSVIVWGGNTASTFHNDTWALGGPLHLTAAALPSLVGPDDPSYFVALAGGGYGNYSFTWTGTPPDCPIVNASVMECESEIPGNYSLVSHLVDTAGNLSTAVAAFQVLHQLAADLAISPATIDLGQSSTLSVTVIGGGPIANYSWLGLPVGCSAATGAVVTCTPLSSGYFSVVVTVTDTLGHVTTTPDLALQVNALPSVGIWSNVSIGVAPVNVQFYSSVFGGSPSYTFLWTFGDGQTSTGPDPAHAYATSGVYDAGLTVTDARGGVAASANLTVDVLNPLVVQVQDSSAYPNVDQSVAFTALVSGGGSPYQYAWTFGDGGTSTAVAPTHAFSASGPHSVVLVVTDAHRTAAVTTIVVDVQGSASTSSGSQSPLASPWVDGLIGAVVGIAVSIVAFRSPATPRDERAPGDRPPPSTVEPSEDPEPPGSDPVNR